MTGPHSPHGGTISVWGAAFLGVGSMVGAGIFALLGQAGAVAGSAVWVSFVVGGVIALLCGYSFAKLGVRYPARGGLSEYLVRGFGPGVFSGAANLLFFVTTVVVIAMVASAFGEYGAAMLFGRDYPQLWVNVFESALIVGLTALNFVGAAAVGKAETVVVVFKLAILVVFTAATLFLVDAARLAPSTWPEPEPILGSMALTFLAYAGFNVISNTAENMANPSRDIPRALFLAIGGTMVLYVAISVAVSGTLSLQEIQDNAETVLAVAAEPVIGHAGFVIMAVGALAATASSVNANLFSIANITHTLARDGSLPERFGRPRWASTDGLLITAAIALVLTNLVPLSVIASIASATFLLVYLLVCVVHLKLRREAGGNPVVIAAGALGCFTALAFWANYTWAQQRHALVVVAAFVAASFAVSAALRLARRGS